MADTDTWIPEIFSNAIDGVSSAVSPELILPTQLAWGINIACRGAKPSTRPPLRLRMILPTGLVQGSGYFGLQGGMGIVSIAGRLYRIRIQGRDFSYELIPLGSQNSPVLKQVWMQQTVESLVIQDGQSDAIIYNGSVATRSNPGAGGVPRGRMMAYGNGRLWVAINANELVAGDIRTGTPGSELLFTETQYLTGGGKLFFDSLTGLAFIPVTGTSDYGALMVFGDGFAKSLRADITDRSLWAQMPGFITDVINEAGCASDASIVEINQDLYWRDNDGGIRSIRSSLADESGQGNAPISREVSRVTDFESKALMKYCSAINLDNRLLMLGAPFLNENGGISWRKIISLDFAPVSTMRGKTQPAYDGEWTGAEMVSMFSGKFGGKPRGFVISTNPDGTNALWEILPTATGDIADVTVDCGDLPATNRILSSIEYGSRDFGDPKRRKRLERCDVYLNNIQGELGLRVFWRTDNNQKWLEWQEEEVEVCAKMTDPEGSTPHTWKNLLPQQRPQVKTFTIPTGVDEITKFGQQNGFEFQIRLVWEGKCTIDKTTLWATMLDEPAWAQRETVTDECVDNNVTGNEQDTKYVIPVHNCQTIFLTEDSLNGDFSEAGQEGPCNWQVESVPYGVDPATVKIDDPTDCDSGFTLPAYGDYTFSTPDGEGTTLIRVAAQSSFNYEAFCRTRSGIAVYCGFAEFQGCVSTPPKFYLTKETQGDMDITQSVAVNCANPTNPGTGSCTPANCDTPVEGQWSISWDEGSGMVLVRVGASGGYDADWFGGNCVGSIDWDINGGAHTGTVNSASTPTGVGTSACAGYAYAEWTFAAGRGTTLNFTAGAGHRGLGTTCPLGTMTYVCGQEPTITDHWDITQDYSAGLEEDPPVCELVETNNSYRQMGIEAPITIPVASPTSYPGSNVQITLGGSDPCATEVAGNGVCALYNGGSPNIYRSYDGDVEISLSNEDTADDAMDRQFDGPDDGWGIWGFPYSGNCAQPGCCLAFEVEVEPGESVFGFQQAQFRISGTGFSPERGYQAEVQFWRRAHDTEDPYELFQTGTYSLDVQEDGTATLTELVPNEAGFDTYAASFAVTRS